MNSDDNSRHGSGFGGFFVISSLMSLFTGEKKRERDWEAAIADVEYEKNLRSKNEDIKDDKHSREFAFLGKKRATIRQYKLDESRRMLEADLNKSELKMFFRDWPLDLDINAVLKILSFSQVLPYFVVARHRVFSMTDSLSREYPYTLSILRGNLRKMDKDFKDDHVLSFKDTATRLGGPAVANVFAMMQAIPVFMILPSVSQDGKHLLFDSAVWTKDSSFPYFNNSFVIEYSDSKMRNDKEYKRQKLDEIEVAEATIAGVLFDCYQLAESCYQLTESAKTVQVRFPSLAETIRLKDYPDILGFALNEYKSLTDPGSILYDCRDINGRIRDGLSVCSFEGMACKAADAYDYLTKL